MHVQRLPSLLLVLAIAVAAPSSADASCVIEVVSDEPSDHIDGIPVEGVVPVFMSAQQAGFLPTPHDSFTVTAEVTDASDALVAGTVETFANRAVWRADSPLDPGATYSLTFTDGGSLVTFDLTFTVETNSSARTSGLELESIDYYEFPLASREACCDQQPQSSCGASDYSMCWTLEYEYSDFVAIDFNSEALARRYHYYRTADDASPHRLRDINGPYDNPLLASPVTDGGPPCLTLIETNLIDGSETSFEICGDSAEFFTVPLPELTEPDASACGGNPLVDSETGEPIDVGGGCSASGGGTGGPIAALFIVVVLAGLRRPQGKHRR